MQSCIVIFGVAYSSCVFSCQHKGEQAKNCIASKKAILPENAIVEDENQTYQLLKVVANTNEMGWDKIILYKYNKETQTIEDSIVTHPEISNSYNSTSKKLQSIDTSMDSLCTISNAKLMPMQKNKIVVSSDIGPLNTEIFILDFNKRIATKLPVNRAFVGFTSEEGLLICQSRINPSSSIGPYNIIQIFDSNGKFIKAMSLKGFHNEMNENEE